MLKESSLLDLIRINQNADSEVHFVGDFFRVCRPQATSYSSCKSVLGRECRLLTVCTLLLNSSAASDLLQFL